MFKLNDGGLLGFCKLQIHNKVVAWEMYWPAPEACMGPKPEKHSKLDIK